MAHNLMEDGASTGHAMAAAELAPLLAVDAPTVGTAFAVGSRIVGFGWALAATPVAEVAVLLDGRFVCHATRAIPRPDLVQAYPRYAFAGQAGFTFEFVLTSPAGERVELGFRMQTVDGRKHEVSVPIRVLPPATIGADTLRFNVDEAGISADGLIGVAGWALSPLGPVEIRLTLDGAEIGTTVAHKERSDVGTLLHDAKALRCGFEIRTQAPDGCTPGPHTLKLYLSVLGSPVHELDLPVIAAARAVASPGAVAAAPSESEMIKLYIDSPELKEGVSVVQVHGGLGVQGWALARAGISAVSVCIDDAEIGQAYYGIRREDVAAAFPDWPHRLLCGYGMSVPSKALRPGRHSVHVKATDTAGRVCSRTFEIDVEASVDLPPHECLRRTMNLAQIRLNNAILTAAGCQPRFELLLPVCADAKQIALARATLASIAAQEYGHYHVAVCGPCDPDTLLGGLGLEPGRVDFVQHTREALRAAGNQGECLVGLLQAGDVLGCDALLEIALASAIDQQADFIYSDERRFDPASGAVKPYYKPGWSPDLLLSGNYIGRLWFARAATLQAHGVSDVSLDPAHEYELVLNLTHVSRHIVHVPKLLCESVTVLEDVQHNAACLQRVVQARGIVGDVLPGCLPGVYRLRRAVTSPGLVSIIIPTCGARGFIKACIESIRRKTAYNNFEIVCVDNIPPDQPELRQWLAQHADRVVATQEPFNWSRFNNLGAGEVARNSEYLLFLNDDIEAIEPDWLSAMLEHAQRPEVGVVGPLLLYPDGSIQHASLFMLSLGQAHHSFRFARSDEPGPFGLTLSQRNVLAVTGACMLVKRATFTELGGFEEAHAIVNNDLDFCMRSLTHARLVVFSPYARLIHHEMGSRSSTNDLYDTAHFERAWRRSFGGGDPYYNPNLTHEGWDFSTDPEPTRVVYGRDALGDITRVRAILAVKLDHVGDFITAFPALRRIKMHFPHARLCLLASNASARLARLEPSIDEVIEFNFFNQRSDLGKLDVSAQEMEHLRARLASYRFDIAIDLRKHLETRDLLKQTGAKLTAGYERDGRFPWLDVAIEWEGDAPLFAKRQHVSEDLLRLVDAVAARITSERVSISESVIADWGQEAELGFPSQVLFSRPVVCIHPTSGNALRQWPLGHFVELIHSLLAEYAVNVAVIGVLGERDTTRELLQRVGSHERLFSVVGLLSLENLPKFLRRCALFVGNNSGPQHIAAGLGVPTIGLHSGVVDAVEWAPVGPAAVALRREMTCSPCYFAFPEQCHRGVACLKGLRPAEVLQTCRQLLLLSGVRHAIS